MVRRLDNIMARSPAPFSAPTGTTASEARPAPPLLRLFSTSVPLRSDLPIRSPKGSAKIGQEGQKSAPNRPLTRPTLRSIAPTHVFLGRTHFVSHAPRPGTTVFPVVLWVQGCMSTALFRRSGARAGLATDESAVLTICGPKLRGRRVR